MTQVVHTGYDDVTLSIIRQVTPNPFFVCAYLDGSFANVDAARKMFPHAKIITITVRGLLIAMACDCENGDLTVEQAAQWAKEKLARGEIPILYASVSTWIELLKALNALGIKREQVILWTAHYINRAHICGPQTCHYPGFDEDADGTQFTDSADHLSLDENLVTDRFLGIKTVIAAPKVSYAIFPIQPLLWKGQWYRERAAVESYDDLRKHPLLNRSKLRKVHSQLEALAERIYFRATHEWSSGAQVWLERKADWAENNYGARFKAIGLRLEGKKLV